MPMAGLSGEQMCTSPSHRSMFMNLYSGSCCETSERCILEAAVLFQFDHMR